MSGYRTTLMACLLLAACGGNPFPDDGSGGGDPDVSNSSASTLPGTNRPTSGGDITRTEEKGKGPNMDGSAPDVTGNGFAEGYEDDPATDTFTVDNLAFDGGNVYTRSGSVPNLGPAQVYAGAGTFADNQTGALIDQFSYRALYGVSTSGRTNFAIVRTGAYVGYGFGGFIYSRDGGVTLPTEGQANYTGEYAGLRDFNGRGGMQMVTGDMEMSIDFNDFNPDESPTNNGAGIQGQVTNRRIFDLAGNDITASVLAEINADKNPDFDLTALPTLVFRVGPGMLDNNGEAEGELDSTIVSSGKAELFEAGKYYAVISGDDADEVAGVIVVTADVGGVTVRETGGFILYRP